MINALWRNISRRIPSKSPRRRSASLVSKPWRCKRNIQIRSFSHAARPVLNVTARDQELPQVQMFICRVWLVIKANTLTQSADEFDPLLGHRS